MKSWEGQGTIKSHQVPDYLKWVADCYAFPDAPDSTFINSLQECLDLRMKDIDLEQNLIIVRAGK